MGSSPSIGSKSIENMVFIQNLQGLEKGRAVKAKTFFYGDSALTKMQKKIGWGDTQAANEDRL